MSFVDAVGDTLYNLAAGFSQGYNQAVGNMSRYAVVQSPYGPVYQPIYPTTTPVYNTTPTYQPYYYPTTQPTSSVMPLVLLGLALFLLMKD